MAKLTESIKNSIKDAIKGKITSNKASSEKTQSSPFLKISAKNFLSITGFARDLNVAKRNVEQLVELMGGKPRKGDQVDAHFLKEDERERKLEAQFTKEDGKAEQIKPKKKEKGLFDKLKDKFSANAILKSIGKYLVIGVIVTTIFLAFKDTFIEWASKLWETIKVLFDEFVGDIKKWFKDSIQPIIEKVLEFVQPMIDVISNMFKKIGDFFVESFSKIKDIFEPVMAVISKIWDKFMGMIDSLKTALKNKIEILMDVPGADIVIPSFITSWLGITTKKEKEAAEAARKQKEAADAARKQKEAADAARKQKEAADTERKQKESVEAARKQKEAVEAARKQKEAADTERVRKQEEKAKYTGSDEIVRKRLGLEDKTPTMLAQEKKSETQGVLVDSSGKPVVSGTGEQIRTGVEPEVKPTPIPKPTPAPKVEIAPAQIPKPETAPAPTTPTVTKPSSKEDLSPKPEGVSAGGKFSDEQKFVESLKPWAKYVSDKIGGKVPPLAILGQWAGESGSGKSLPADYNYAGIKAGKKFEKGDFVLTEERYTNEQLERAKKSGEDLAKVITSPNDTIRKKGRQVTIDEWFGKGSYQKAKDEGKNWVQVKSYFAKFKDIKDFSDSFASFISTPRYAKAREQTTAAGFGFEIAKAGYATAAADKYSAKVAAFDQKYSSGGQIASASSEVASGQRQQQKSQTPVVVNAPTNNTTVVNKKQTASAPRPKNTAGTLVARAT
jgi:flagellum-specific peptidoglycan hydrolase FlgJ